MKKHRKSSSPSPLKSITAADLKLITGGGTVEQNGKEMECKAGDDNALRQSIVHCLDNRSRVDEAGALARRKAEQFTWDRYGDRWMEILNAVHARDT